MGRREERRLLGSTRCRWECNIKINLQIVGWGGMEWINLAQDRERWRALVNSVMNLRVPLSVGNLTVDGRLASQEGQSSMGSYSYL